jgi:hypothetical protein
MTKDWFEQYVIDAASAGWISRTNTRRRLNALRTVYQQIDIDSRRRLPPTIIFAPSLDAGGQTMRRDVPPDFAFVYLAPTLEFNWQIDVDYVVAHELAHVVLDHGGERPLSAEQAALPHEQRADEVAVEALVAKWRISKRNPADARFARLLKRIMDVDEARLKVQSNESNVADGLFDEAVTGQPAGEINFDTVVEHLHRQEDEPEDRK